ncbi:large ribosomal subunit protein mL39-like [Littorina saxatilis]|uniref:Threonyl/alanyl tRNA synthetase SAD domain-containing protein n=1 Tax=Littorina saxatilis TaxID=31220 RepID=A0AAN9BM46_9CAEN
MATSCRSLALLRIFLAKSKPAARCIHTESKVTNSLVREKRNALFESEKQRQLSLVSRIEKIEVQYKGQPEDCTLVMNKNLSTPFNCAMHIEEVVMSRSVLALVNGEPWDMHRPLKESCQLHFMHFEDENPTLANEAFWRSCSFMLGYVLETAFKEQHYVQLCSFPVPNVRSGSFVYDADLGLEDWRPNSIELNTLSRTGFKLFFKEYRFERLKVDASVALNMFADNRFKTTQIPSIASRSESGSTVTVYRMGDHVDITGGPLISNTGQLGRFNVTAFHDIESSSYGPLTRVQGTALPVQLPMHYWSYENIIAKRAQKLNTAPVPELKQAQPLQSSAS